MDHTAIDAQAADFLQRRRFWGWTQADQAELESWLDQDVNHRVAFLRLEAGLERIERLAALGPMKRPPMKRPIAAAPRRALSILTKCAAGLALIAALGFGTHYALQPSLETYTTEIGGRKIITLADGSRIEMNTGTVLRVRRSGDQREAWLERGEAYFDIVHSDTSPFHVHAGAHRVTDLGTKFTVRRDAAEMKVALIEGAARIDPADASAKAQPVYLAPGDVAVASNTAISVARETQGSLTNALAWRRGMLIFHRTTLAEAAEQFNRYNTDRLVIADAKTARLTMNGSFPTKDIAGFSAAIRDIFNVQIEQKQGEIVISRP